MMHESMAKAEVKGAMRRAGQRWNDYENGMRRGAPNLGSRKKFMKFTEDVISYHGDLMIHRHKWCHPNSWHFKMEVASVQSEYIEVEGVGKVTGLVINFYDSRRMLKGNWWSGSMSYTSRIYLHEHFLIRTVQRLGLPGVGKIGQYVYPMLNFLIDNYPSMRNLEDHFYLLSEDAVFVIEKLPGLKGVAFKTVLMKEYFSDEQERFFYTAYRQFHDNHSNMMVFMPKSGRYLAVPAEDFMINREEICGHTFWLHDIILDF